MTKQPLITVCIPAYNAEDTIAETLNSLLLQTYPNLEIIVGDNASTDSTREIVRAFGNSNIHLIENKTNIGGEANFQKCMHLGHGVYKAIYHADDMYLPTIIEEEAAALDAHPNIGAVLTRANLINPQGNKIGESKTFSELKLKNKPSMLFDLPSLLKLVLRNYNFLICPSLMMRSSITQAIPDWRGEMFGTSADLDLWLRIAEKFGLGLLNKTLMNYRLSQAQGSHQYNKLRTKPADILRVFHYWINNENVKDRLSQNDLNWFHEWVSRDSLECAARSLLQNNIPLTSTLLKKARKNKCWRQSLNSSTSLKYFLLLLLVHSASLPGLRKICNPLIKKAIYRLT